MTTGGKGTAHISSRSSIRCWYLSSVGLIFLIAHLSYHVQYPGLLSTVGIEPAATRVLPRVFPRLFQYTKDMNIDADSFIEILCLVGIILSAVVASGYFQHASAFFALTAIYYHLTVFGGTFYQFQWDILLTEVGFTTALCYAPWQTKRTIDQRSHNNSIGAWPLRFLLFKLMFMSGVVKIQANCPTWLNLTALEYHFATQCLPGPLAWHAHQSHPLLLRASVAATFVIEIPATFMLLAPLVTARRIGAGLQILLQMTIILTGNYNFFNLLTICLCLPCWEEDGVRKSQSTASRQSFYSRQAQYIACFTFLTWSTIDMCHFYKGQATGHFNVKLAWSKADCDNYIEQWLPYAIPATFLSMFWSAIPPLRENIRCPSRLPIVFVQLGACAFWLGVLSIPMLELTAGLKYTGSKYFFEPWKMAREYHLSSGYGLFRRMTGVGRNPFGSSPSFSTDGWGWGGLEASVVARPEIIIEALYEDQVGDDTNTTDLSKWEEIEFRWKPGKATKRPLQVAPHQPRLDWQMWFAALGSYQHNPWFIAFLDKLLCGCEPAMDLIGLKHDPKRNVLAIRSKLYHYDFTRITTEWNRRIPGVKILPNQGWWEYPETIWTRSLINEHYTPVLEFDNASVQQFLSRSGYSQTCGDYKTRCNDIDTNKAICDLSSKVREWNLKWLPSIVLGAWWVYKVVSTYVVHPPFNKKEKEE